MTNFNLDFTQIHGKLNSRWHPTLDIDNISIKNPKTNTVFLQIQHLSLAFSYRSIYQLEPVFNHIMINGSTITVEYDKNENILVNQQIITNLKTTKPSSFDGEEFMLKLYKFKLSNLNLTLLDSRDHLNPIILKQINLDLTNHLANWHILSLKAQFAKSNLNLRLDWRGPKLTEIGDWKRGDLVITNRDSLNHVINLHANIKNGMLEELTTNFDTSGRQALALNNPLHGKSQISGSLKIIQKSKSMYNIAANDLVISTESGMILNHATLNGSYDINKSGVINLTALELAGLSRFKFNQLTNKLNLSGSLNNLNLNWYGPLNKPQDILFSTKFKDVAIISLESNIPSLNHINGDVVLQPTNVKGKLNLSLHNSKFIYPKQLKQPIIISSLNNTTNWYSESRDGVVLNWESSNVQTKDFNLITSGQYATKTDAIKTHTTIAKLEIAQIPNYLPFSESGMIDFIKTSILRGQLCNIDLAINGDVTRIPFAKGRGELRFATQFNDVTFKFAQDWQQATNLNGTITAQNQAISGKIISGNLGDYVIAKTEYNVPDITSDNAILKMNGFASGATSDFITYLTHTPLNSTLQSLPSQMTISGQSEVNLQLSLPLDDLNKLKLSGNWLFNDNLFNFGKDIPGVSNFHGKLNFTNNGIESSHLTANVLGSKLDIFQTKQKVEVQSPDLDYSAIKQFFMHNNTDFISGRAATKVIYDINNSHLTLYSDLKGVTINAPEPLNKIESTIKDLTIDLHTHAGDTNIDLNYANILYGKFNLNHNMQLVATKLAMGTNDFNLKYHKSSPITVNAKLNNLRILDWTTFIDKLSASSNKYKTQTLKVADSKSKPTLSLYPIQIELTTAAIWLQNYNIDGGRVNITVDKNKISGQIDVPDIYGQVSYATDTSKVDLNLYRLLISTNNLIKVESSTVKKGKPQQLTTTKSPTIPDIKVSIQNLYYQNHYLGNLNALVLQRNNSLYIESATIENKASSTRLRIIDHDLGSKREYTELRLRTNIKSYGLLISKLNIGDNLRKGNGMFDLSLKWKGNIANFNTKKTIGQATLNIKNGEFTHVNPGLFGSLLGVVSLTSLTNVSSLNLNTFFGKGFAFSSWDMNVEILFNKLKIDKLKLVSNAATISSFGNINLDNNTIDSYLTVEPRLGATVATTAGIVTLNPLIGMFVYAGQALIGNPINKALGISYHIKGDVTNPTMSNINLTQQIEQNFNSTTNIIQHPETAFDFELNK